MVEWDKIFHYLWNTFKRIQMINDFIEVKKMSGRTTAKNEINNPLSDNDNSDISYVGLEVININEIKSFREWKDRDREMTLIYFKDRSAGTKTNSASMIINEGYEEFKYRLKVISTLGSK